MSVLFLYNGKGIKSLHLSFAAMALKLASFGAEKKGYSMEELYEGIAAYDAGDFIKAHKILYPLAAYKRDPEAQFHMGMLYFYGEGVDKDVDKAMEWWKKAMRNGHVDAAYRLSEIATSTKTTF